MGLHQTSKDKPIKRATSKQGRGDHDPQPSEAKTVKATHSAEHTVHALADPNTATTRKARGPAAVYAAKSAAPQSAKLGGVKHSAGMDSPKAFKVFKAPTSLSPFSQPPKPHDIGHKSPGEASRAEFGSNSRGSSPANQHSRLHDVCGPRAAPHLVH